MSTTNGHTLSRSHGRRALRGDPICLAPYEVGNLAGRDPMEVWCGDGANLVPKLVAAVGRGAQ